MDASPNFVKLTSKSTLTTISDFTAFVLIAQKKTGTRPGRIEPRAVKRRPKPFSLLTKPREKARAQIRKTPTRKNKISLEPVVFITLY